MFLSVSSGGRRFVLAAFHLRWAHQPSHVRWKRRKPSCGDETDTVFTAWSWQQWLWCILGWHTPEQACIDQAMGTLCRAHRTHSSPRHSVLLGTLEQENFLVSPELGNKAKATEWTMSSSKQGPATACWGIFLPANFSSWPSFSSSIKCSPSHPWLCALHTVPWFVGMGEFSLLLQAHLVT